MRFYVVCGIVSYIIIKALFEYHLRKFMNKAFERVDKMASNSALLSLIISFAVLRLAKLVNGFVIRR